MDFSSANCPSLSASTIQRQGVAKATKFTGEPAACCNDGTLREMQLDCGYDRRLPLCELDAFQKFAQQKEVS